MDVEQVLVSEFLSDYSEDAARFLEQLPAEQAVAILDHAPPEAAARSLHSMAPHVAARCLEDMQPEAAHSALAALPLGTATVLLRRIGDERRALLLASVSPKLRERLEPLLMYLESTAGAIMDPLLTAAPEDITVEQARRFLRASPAQMYYYLYVVDRAQVLVGVVGLRELFMADDDELLREIMNPKVASVSDRATLTAVVAHPGWRDFHALPVVSEGGVFVGMIRHQTLRRLAEAAEQGPGGAAFGTLIALGELYWTGLVELFGGMSSPTRPPGEEI